MNMHKHVHISRFFYGIHGKNPTVGGLLTTYVAGVVSAVIGVVGAYSMGFEVWRIILIGLLFFDVGGGVIANFTHSTRMYYQKPARRRVVFLCLHLIQPVLLAVALGGFWELGVFVAVYAVTASLIINAVHDSRIQRNIAGVLVFMGFLLLGCFNMPSMIIYLFGVLFMVKLLIGFSIRRS